MPLVRAVADRERAGRDRGAAVGVPVRTASPLPSLVRDPVPVWMALEMVVLAAPLKVKGPSR